MNDKLLPAVFHCFRHHVLVHRVNFFAAVGLAAVKVNAEMAVKIVAADCLRSVGHTVHGSCVNMPVVFDQYSTAFPAPVTIYGFHDFCIRGACRLCVNMIGAAPPLDGKDFPGLDILDLESGAFRNLLAPAVKPVQALRRSASSAVSRIGCGCFFCTGGIKFGQRLAVDLSVGCQAVALLEFFNCCLGAVAVISVTGSAVVSQLFQPLLYFFDRTSRITRSACSVRAS